MAANNQQSPEQRKSFYSPDRHFNGFYGRREQLGFVLSADVRLTYSAGQMEVFSLKEKAEC